MRRLLRAAAILALTIPLMGCPNPFGDANDDNQWSDDRANREGKQRWADRDKFIAGLLIIAVVGGIRVFRGTSGPREP